MSDKICYYDVVIAGAGCAGLSLAVRMARSPALSSWNILLLEQQEKNQNDRTWCFWESGKGYFESIVQHRWSAGDVITDEKCICLDFEPFEYKMIRSKHFYAYCKEILQQVNEQNQARRIDIWYEPVTQILDKETYAEVHTSYHTIRCRFAFSSLPRDIPQDKSIHFLWQHFQGWLIRSATPVFDASRMVLMDFRVPQQQATAFMYVLPFSAQEALIEYTVFSKQLLLPEVYDACIEQYMQMHYPDLSFEILEKEQGKIPMTDYTFPQTDKHVIYIGTSGGQTKGSTGYTFPFIQQHSDAILQALENGNSPHIYHQPRKKFYRYYDRLLLDVLSKSLYPGDKLFADLFDKNQTDKVIRFLNEQSTFWEDISIILSLPKKPFLEAALDTWKQNLNR
ncbi:lycopene cyclase family protein [Thermoflavifilum thermophilum]|uniref:Lycopene beta-cyclase n=1 Tax=Thermoflavifilum thermophilum TaxID=1393122 RepID=A0A1I7N827_9BACT|nr:lycopene cyclase family protein [Thermoflavifilum thermophilum]SFV30716.1 lycopene beta-cyclase [Thermoflavifilum thermophilum]